MGLAPGRYHMSDASKTLPTSALDRFFRISARHSTIRTEVVAGLTTFVTMAYIIFVVPAIMEKAGMPHDGAVAAALWSTALCTIAMGVFANYPVGLAPGMGLISFFAFYVCGTRGLTWQAGLGAVFISGVVFFILTVTKLREMIINSVPMSLKSSIVVAIGMFITFIGLQSANIVVDHPATLVQLGTLDDPPVLLSCFGILAIGVLMALKVRGAMLLGILLTAIVGMIVGINPAPTKVSDVVSLQFAGMGDTFMQMDIMGALNFGLMSIIFTFTVVELFDNIGTLIGVTRAAGLMDDKGHIEGIDRALMTDSLGTMVSAAMGTCTVTSYIESSSGINAGGRTGLTAVVVGICFLLAFVFTPLTSLIPGWATAPALIIVGALMMSNVRYINFDDFTELLPCFLTVIMMPLTYSIANGFGFGFLSYCLLKLCTGRAREVKPIMWIISIVFMISFTLH